MKLANNNKIIWWILFMVVGHMYCINVSNNMRYIQPGLPQNYTPSWPRINCYSS